ncbi:hypothetical protein PF007_g30952 [Phytophthora fragariae]|uniref:RxLR effector protein n=1 Tax=Phytophthora fragariae TaxID=53985 RepID=A0A6A3DD85_9STRA|nr:hypothetical protein PF009_g31447 [Phytophthora fragariae]KAE9059453.1 hypothetical protein PF007_g30952 [Phytophthora fragariae]KAE9061797.1 hypothetical protein PF006_g31309 [Phytophthora fragariae]KAE9158849.1 hypothetical protein PF004_g31742 [Phytophthora fragariae]
MSLGIMMAAASRLRWSTVIVFSVASASLAVSCRRAKCQVSVVPSWLPTWMPK